MHYPQADFELYKNFLIISNGLCEGISDARLILDYSQRPLLQTFKWLYMLELLRFGEENAVDLLR